MKLRTVIEVSIFGIFLIAALVVIFRDGDTAPVDDISAAEHIRSGDRLYEAGSLQYSAAAVEYWEALKKKPDALKVLLRLANIYYHNGWNYEPLRELDEIERIDPDYTGLHLLRGKIYHRMGEADKEFESFQKAVVAQPDNAEVRYYLGTIYQQKSIMAKNRAMVLNSEGKTDEANAAVEQANLLMEQSISELQKAIELDAEPDIALKSHLQLGRIYRLEDEREKAEVAFMAALDVEPDSAEVKSELRRLYNQQAEEYKGNREYDKLTEVYEKILKIDPDNIRNVEIYMELGDRYFHNEQYERSTEMYEAAARLDPMNMEIFISLKELEILRNMDGE